VENVLEYCVVVIAFEMASVVNTGSTGEHPLAPPLTYEDMAKSRFCNSIR
jgi:hypothetical protein